MIDSRTLNPGCAPSYAACSALIGTARAILDPAQQTKQTIEDRQRMRRTTGDVEVDRNRAGGAIVLFRMAGVNAAGDRAGADGDDDLRRGDGVVGLLQRETHVRG